MFFCSRLISILMVLAALLSVNVSVAEEDEDKKSPSSKYLEIEPVFVTNYGGTTRLAYMKIQVTLRVVGAEGEQQAKHHMPAIKDALLNLFAVQTNDTIHSATGKENLRKQSFDVVAAALVQEDNESHLEDLLFTSFVVQR